MVAETYSMRFPTVCCHLPHLAFPQIWRDLISVTVWCQRTCTNSGCSGRQWTWNTEWSKGTAPHVIAEETLNCGSVDDLTSPSKVLGFLQYGKQTGLDISPSKKNGAPNFHQGIPPNSIWTKFFYQWGNSSMASMSPYMSFQLSSIFLSRVLEMICRASERSVCSARSEFHLSAVVY